MAVVTRQRVVGTAPDDLWRVISDPEHLVRWWPRVVRVENVQGPAARKRTRWTTVLAAEGGRQVRADYRCTASVTSSRYCWEQELGDGPFAKHFASVATQIELTPEPSGTRVTITVGARMRGMARLGGGLFIARSTRSQLDEALSSLADITKRP
ncbi:MAG: SRPBCC family protein [Solirubrobacterales bacterium]